MVSKSIYLIANLTNEVFWEREDIINFERIIQNPKNSVTISSDCNWQETNTHLAQYVPFVSHVNAFRIEYFLVQMRKLILHILACVPDAWIRNQASEPSSEEPTTKPTPIVTKVTRPKSDDGVIQSVNSALKRLLRDIGSQRFFIVISWVAWSQSAYEWQWVWFHAMARG